MIIITQIIITISSIAIVFGLNSITQIYGFAIFVTLLSILMQLSSRFKGYLFYVWQIAFLYIIAIEGFLHADEITFLAKNNLTFASQYLVVTFFISMTSYLVLYLLKQKHHVERKIKKLKFNGLKYRSSKKTIALIFLMYLFYVFFNYNVAINAFLGGRVSLDSYSGPLSFILNPFNTSIGIVLPAIICFTLKYANFFKKYNFIATILSLPIFLVLFLKGTRYALLFSVSGFLVIMFYGYKLKFYDWFRVIFIGILILISAEIMMQSRTIGLYNYLFNSNVNLFSDLISLTYTREGITFTNTLLIDYFRYNPHTYGLQSIFLFIFWIPRAIWASKPSMMGYWLIREINPSGFAEGHSISYGFAADAYADFGILGGIIFSIIMGILIYKLHEVASQTKKRNEFNFLYGACFFPFTFFAMRSFQTSVISLIGMLSIVWIYKKTLINKLINKQEAKK